MASQSTKCPLILNLDNLLFRAGDPNEPIAAFRHTSMIHKLIFLSLLVAAVASAADFPAARVITDPGPAYADSARSWQGIPGIERAKSGRLWVTWYSASSDNGRTWSEPVPRHRQRAARGAAAAARRAASLLLVHRRTTLLPEAQRHDLQSRR